MLADLRVISLTSRQVTFDIVECCLLDLVPAGQSTITITIIVRTNYQVPFRHTDSSSDVFEYHVPVVRVLYYVQFAL